MIVDKGYLHFKGLKVQRFKVPFPFPVFSTCIYMKNIIFDRSDSKVSAKLAMTAFSLTLNVEP